MILVTGASGILGRVIVWELLKKGKIVRAAKRKSTDTEEVRKSLRYYPDYQDILFNEIEWFNIDLNDQISLQQELHGVEEVYHCAAKVSYDPLEKEKVDHINVDGTQNILECCKNSTVKKFLYVSSALIFNDDPIDENSSFISGKDTIYAVSKYKADIAVCKAFEEGVNTIIINPGLIIGSGGWEDSSGNFLKTFINGRYTFPGGTGCVDVRDVARIAIQLMDDNIFGERFLVVSENKKYSELSNIIKQRVNTIKPFVLSEKILYVGRFLNKLSFGKIPGLRMLTKPNIKFLISFKKISNGKIVKRLKYDFIPVKESLLFHLNNFLSDKNKL